MDRSPLLLWLRVEGSASEARCQRRLKRSPGRHSWPIPWIKCAPWSRSRRSSLLHRPNIIDEVTQLCASKTNGDRIGVSVVAGGRERADSVAAALTSVDEDVDVVLVHDAARAFAPAELFSRVISAVRNGSVAAVPALPVTDTIKEVNSEEIVLRTVARHSLRAVQTPQGFRRDVLVAAHADHQAVARAGDLAPTDDAGMVEAGGHDVLLVRGSDAAFKITTPFDRLIARAIVMQREEPDER